MDIKLDTNNINLSNNLNLEQDNVRAKDLRPENSQMMSFSGHGQIEVYPENMSIAYVVSHELRHAQRNRLEALAKNYELTQSIDYKMALRGQKMVATGGTTNSSVKSKSAKVEDVIRKNKSNLTKVKGYEEKLVIHRQFLEMKRKDMERALSDLGGEISSTVGNGDAKDNSGSDEFQRLKEIAMRLKLHLLKQNISEIKAKEIKMNDVNISTDLNNATPGNQVDNIRERDFGRILTDSFKFISRQMPPVELLDKAGSAFKVDKAIKEINEINTDSPVSFNIKMDGRFASSKISAYNSLTGLLMGLNKTIDRLNNKASFNIYKAESSDVNALEVSTSLDSHVGTNRVDISQVAVSHRVTSDVHNDPFEALNLSGTIQVNGFDINITASDSLNSIRDKINYGEDTNKNSTLDLPEDLNGNGQLDILVVEGDNGIVIYEDINHNKTIDGTEDINNNERLDGGMKDSGVFAEIINNQLVLNSINPGESVRLKNDNNILDTLGFVLTDSYNNEVLKNELKVADNSLLTNINPQMANFKIDGTKHTSDSNSVKNKIPGLSLELKGKSSRQVEVNTSVDIKPVVSKIKKFMNKFNNVISFLNNQIAKENVLRDEIKANRIHRQLRNTTNQEIKKSSAKIKKISDVGLNEVSRKKDYFNELTITNLMKRLTGGIKSSLAIPSRGSNSVFKKMDQIGIRSLNDNTLKIDESKLKEALTKNLKEVVDLFTGNNGILPRLQTQISTFVDDLLGVIQLQVKAIKKTTLNNTFVNDLRSSKEKISVESISSKTKSSTIAEITGAV